MAQLKKLLFDENVNNMLLKKIVYHFSTIPSKIAVYSESGNMTYGLLDDISGDLAFNILMRKLPTDALIAIVMSRTSYLIAAMVGVMRAGIAYTIVEPGQHQSETINKLDLIKPDLILNDDDNETVAQSSVFPSVSWHTLKKVVKSVLPDLPDGSATAYVLFTSGSTGAPKGVEVSFDNLAHYCHSLADKLALLPHLTFGHVSTLSADLGNTSLFLSLWTGGTLYLFNEAERKDPAILAQAILEHRIQVLKITPTHWRPVLNKLKNANVISALLEYLILGGETLPFDLALECLKLGICEHLVNHYGPTETTIGVTIQRITVQQLNSEYPTTVPIGKPFGKNHLLLRDKNGDVHATGEHEGELYISGPSVTKGYRGLSQLTKNYFITLPDLPGRYYRTGDYVRRDANGTMYFIGRVDRQVKINGYRVELESVEHHLHLFTGVEQVFAVNYTQDCHDYILCAFTGRECEAATLRQALSARVPAWMIPNRFEYLSCFPTNSNGKIDSKALKEEIIKRFRESRLKDSIGPTGDPSNKCEQDVIGAFMRQLNGVTFCNDDDFFQLGGDSLDAIQVVSALQLMGYPLTALSFLEQPSVKGVVENIKQIVHTKSQNVDLIGVVMPCSPVQKWFFNRGFNEPNRWTQAIALEVGVELDRLLLHESLRQVCADHPMLSAEFFQDADQQWCFKSTSASQPVLFDTAGVYYPWVEREAAVHQFYFKLESQLDIRHGNLFRVALLEFDNRQSILLLVAHHLIVDIISWRLLIDDMMIHYSAHAVHGKAELNVNRHRFGHWLQHIINNRHVLEKDINFWLSQPEPKITARSAGIEQDSQTVWLVLDEKESEHILQIAPERCSTTPERFLLSAYLEESVAMQKDTVITVDIESHGRLTLEHGIDVCRATGWFTSIFPQTFSLGHKNGDEVVNLVHQRMEKLPNLGVAYGLLTGHNALSPSLCFNFVGQFKQGFLNKWKLRCADVSLPSLRGESNNRVHELKLTARFHFERLLVDINFNNKQYSHAQMICFARGLRKRLLRHLPGHNVEPYRLIVDAGNYAGAIWNPLPTLLLPRGKSRNYQHILITGVTGFIGIHVLEQLLKQTSAKIYCLIRPSLKYSVDKRLNDVWLDFFSPELLAKFEDRIYCMAADVSEIKLGLNQMDWCKLSKNIDAIYHFAADTRLMCGSETARDNILTPVEECIRLAENGKAKTLHFMSTLAVSGTCKDRETGHFNEYSLDIGQEFQNSYEKYKYDSEILVRDYSYSGGNTFIYRSGNVTGRSDSGAFQRNAGSNRWVQCLKAIVALGKFPLADNNNIVLSPVDIVAQAIVALSLDPTIDSGTFHVDSSLDTPIGNFIDALNYHGIPILKVNSPSITHLFNQTDNFDNSDITIGHFWLSRGERNIHFNHHITHQLLKKHGISFNSLNSDWVSKFVKHLIDRCVIQPQSTSKRTRHIT